MDATTALDHLLAGNERFREGRSVHCGQAPAQRARTAASQSPVAAVLGCADSRVPHEAVFDAGIGEVFSIRVAGNVIGDNVLASLEYAVTTLHVPLILILGHRSCGAVTAACAHRDHGTEVSDAVRPVVDRILAGIGGLGSVESTDDAVVANVAHQVAGVAHQAGPLGAMIRAGHVGVVGAVYDVATGAVDLTPEVADTIPPRV